jgi:septal ring factor EnvC (AmiA/AmiB activator)
MPPSIRGGGLAYGIGDVIRLLRTLPVDQHAELVIRVIRTTLESVNVRVPELIEDAAKQQHKLSERISALQAQILDLTKQIDTHRAEVSRLEADLAETTSAKERLKSAEQAAAVVAGAGMPMQHVPPPPPLNPPIKTAPPKPPDQPVKN